MTEEVVVEKAAEAEVTYTPDEDRAMSNGWKPKDQWEGDPDDWVPAKQFNRNGELFGRINSYKHKIQSLEKTVGDLVKHNERVYETGYKDALDKLKAERRVALREGDVDAVEQIEERIEQVEKQRDEGLTEIKQVGQQQQMHPAFEPWLENNPWYGDNKMRAYADAIANDLVSQSQGRIPFESLLEQVTDQMREEFPEKVGGKKVSQRPAQRPNGSDRGDGQGGARQVGRPRQKDELAAIEDGLDEGERSIMNSLVNSGVITKEKYLQDIQKVNKRKGR